MLGYAIALIADFDRGAAGLQYVTDDNWISELGIRYQLGVDGLNLFLIALTALLWVPATLWARAAHGGPAAAVHVPHGPGRDRGARRLLPPRTWRCSSSSST